MWCCSPQGLFCPLWWSLRNAQLIMSISFRWIFLSLTNVSWLKRHGNMWRFGSCWWSTGWMRVTNIGITVLAVEVKIRLETVTFTLVCWEVVVPWRYQLEEGTVSCHTSPPPSRSRCYHGSFFCCYLQRLALKRCLYRDACLSLRHDHWLEVLTLLHEWMSEVYFYSASFRLYIRWTLNASSP